MFDPEEGEINDSVMLAFLPATTEWSRIEMPHMTLVYAGKTKDLSATQRNDLAKDASSIALLTGPFPMRVISTEVFGPDNDKVNVLRFQPTQELWSMRRFVERWNKSEFPFTPHATIGPAQLMPEIVPRYVRFNRLVLGWGDEYLTFKLSGEQSMDY